MVRYIKRRIFSLQYQHTKLNQMPLDFKWSFFLSVADELTYPTSSEWFDGSNCSWVDAVSWGCNTTINGTSSNSTSSDVTSFVLMAVTSVVLALIILATIVGESINMNYKTTGLLILPLKLMMIMSNNGLIKVLLIDIHQNLYFADRIDFILPNSF